MKQHFRDHGGTADRSGKRICIAVGAGLLLIILLLNLFTYVFHVVRYPLTIFTCTADSHHRFLARCAKA